MSHFRRIMNYSLLLEINVPTIKRVLNISHSSLYYYLNFDANLIPLKDR